MAIDPRQIRVPKPKPKPPKKYPIHNCAWGHGRIMRNFGEMVLCDRFSLRACIEPWNDLKLVGDLLLCPAHRSA